MKSLETRQAEVGSAIDASTSALLAAEDKIGKAKEMIRKANLILSKAKLVRLEETARLEQLKLKMKSSHSRDCHRGQLWRRLKLV